MQITTITPEQKARFQEWRDKWIRIGLSTEPADFDKAEKAALRAYTLCDLERPKVILRMGSPYGATMGGALTWLMLRGMLPGIDQKVSQQVAQQVSQQVAQQVSQPVAQQVSQQVAQQVAEQVWWQVRQQVSEQVDWEVSRQVEPRVSRQVEQQVSRQVEQQVRQQVDRQVGQQVWQQVGPQVWQQVWQRVGWRVALQVDQRTVLSVIKKGFNNDRGGSFWADWCAYITFMRDILGWRNPTLAQFTIDEDLATSCGWVWWHKDILTIGDRPSEIHLDAEGQLHNENGPSIAYRDGWKLYHVHGVAVPDFVVERPEAITVKHVEKERNAEVRRIMVSRMGLERFIRESGLKPIHSDDFGTLYRKEMPDDEPLVVVKVVNSTPESDGSRKEYFLRVPPTMKRAREAVAWTFGMGEKEYLPKVET